MFIVTANKKPKQIEEVIISQDIKEATNEKLVSMLSHKSYEFCVVQDMSNDTSLEQAADKLLQLFMESLNRIFEHNKKYNVSQFRMYEVIETLFDKDMSYNTIKALSALKRIKILSGIDHENDKYVIWVITRIKKTSKGLCNKLNFISSYSTMTTVPIQSEQITLEDVDTKI
jgi:hypothetical protein